MLATRGNMRECERANIKAMQFCSVCSGEYSATSGDYFQYSDDYQFTCCEEPCQLVTKKTVIADIDI